jgi:hypothetical protein
MIRQIKDCSCGNRCEGNTNQCASCNARDRKLNRMRPPEDSKPVAKVSKNQSKENAKYLKKLKVWRRGKKCAGKFPHNCSMGFEITCHHMQGRIGYADEWARENEVPLLLDERFWLPVCWDAHKYIEEHKKWACENGYSFLRVSDPVFRISNLKP